METYIVSIVKQQEAGISIKQWALYLVQGVIPVHLKIFSK